MGSVGDCWTISTCVEITPTADEVHHAIVTWHVRAITSYGTWEDLADKWEFASQSLWPMCSDISKAIGAFYQQKLPTSSPMWARRFATPRNGTQSGGNYPYSVAVELLRGTTSPNRANWGRAYIPYPTVTARKTGAPNEVAPTYAADLLSRVATLDAGLDGVGANATRWESGTISLRSHTSSPHFTPVANYTVSPRLSNLAQRGRRTYRCPFDIYGFVCTYSSDGLYDSTGAVIHDGRQWRWQSDRDPRIASGAHTLAGFSEPGYDDSWWNRTYYSVVSYGCTSASYPGAQKCPEWAHYPLVPSPLPGSTANAWFPGYHHYGDAPMGDSVYAYFNETGYGRRVFNVPANVRFAQLEVFVSDSGTAWVNGTQVYSRSYGVVRDCNIVVVDSIDVTRQIRPGELNCLALTSTQSGEDIYGGAGHPMVCDGTGCSRNCCPGEVPPSITCETKWQSTFAGRLWLQTD